MSAQHTIMGIPTQNSQDMNQYISVPAEPQSPGLKKIFLSMVMLTECLPLALNNINIQTCIYIYVYVYIYIYVYAPRSTNTIQWNHIFCRLCILFCYNYSFKMHTSVTMHTFPLCTAGNAQRARKGPDSQPGKGFTLAWHCWRKCFLLDLPVYSPYIYMICDYNSSIHFIKIYP